MQVTREGLSEDTILGGRIQLRQPCTGGRVCIDTILLAAAVTARRGERVIEAGCGTGAAALAVAARCPGAEILGVDRDARLVGIARQNATLNALDSRLAFCAGDVRDGAAGFGRGAFDHALANPPYEETGSPDAPIAGAGPEPDTDRNSGTPLGDWIDFCLEAVRVKGTVTFIHRADRLDCLLAALHTRVGDLAVCPLWPRAGLPAKRIIVQARKGAKGASMLMPGLVLHEAQGLFTQRAEAILREGAALDLSRTAWCRLSKARAANA